MVIIDTVAQIYGVDSKFSTPLAYLASVYMDPNVAIELKIAAAGKAAPFVHSRLTSVQVSGADGGPVEIQQKIVSMSLDPALAEAMELLAIASTRAPKNAQDHHGVPNTAAATRNPRVVEVLADGSSALAGSSELDHLV